MSNLLRKSLLASPAAVGAALAMSGAAFAVEAQTVELDTAAFEALVLEEIAPVAEPVELAQLTSVSELSDVRPTDWAFTALQRLVEQYQCIEGFPNRTFRGNQAMTRYEFAAGLNSCLDRILEIVGAGGVTAEDLEAIRQLQQQFQAELAQLRGRVDVLEADVAELEANQFSTTTKLRGQVDSHIVVPIDVLGTTDTSTTFESRARLNFDTSFTGEDRLRIRLQAGNNVNALGESSNLVGFRLDNGGSGGFDVTVDDFVYEFPVGDRLDITLAANGFVTENFVTSRIVPFSGDGVAEASGASFYRFGGGDPAVGDTRLSSGSSGLGFSFALTENITLDGGYAVDSTSDAADATVGLFAGTQQSYIGQLSYISDGLLDIALVYINATNSAGGENLDTFAVPINLDFGGFMIGGYYAFHDQGGDDTSSFMGGIAIPNLFGLGNELGVYGGIEPRFGADPLLVEAYYEIGVSEFLTITPAVVYLDTDAGNADDTGLFGAIRATFRF
ncbi:MAG: iron uptake porin [Cyanobacteria bacterium J06639_16]